MKNFGLVFFLLFCVQFSFAGFDYRGEVTQLQRQLDDLYKRGKLQFPVVIMEREKLFLQASKRNAIHTNRDAEAIRLEILQDFVSAKIGFKLDRNQLVNLDVYTYLARDSAAALQIKKDFFAPGGTVMCAVFPMMPNSNAILENSRMLQIPTEKVYGDYSVNDYQYPMQYEEMALISLYHEVGHCLDYKKITQFMDDQTDSHSLHLGESFAEVFALLALEKRGVSQLAARRSVLRSVYSRSLGHYMGTHPQNGFGNPVYVSGGSIYFLSPSIDAAESYMTTHKDLIKKQGWMDFVNTAHQISDRSATPFRSFSAISSFLQAKQPAPVIKQYRDWSVDEPRFFKQAYEDLQKYIAYTDQVMSKAFIKSMVSKKHLNDLSKIDYMELCHLEKVSDEKLFEKIDFYRGELESSKSKIEDMQSRSKELNHVFDKMQDVCKSIR